MTDFYKECEDGLIKLLQTLTTFFPEKWQVSDDDTIVMRGADYLIVVRPSAFPIAATEGETAAFVDWNTRMDLFVRFEDYKESWNKFKAFRSVIFNLFMKYPTLDDTVGVIAVSMTGDQPTQYLKLKDAPEAKPAYIVQTVRVVMRQLVTYVGEGEL